MNNETSRPQWTVAQTKTVAGERPVEIVCAIKTNSMIPEAVRLEVERALGQIERSFNDHDA